MFNNDIESLKADLLRFLPENEAEQEKNHPYRELYNQVLDIALVALCEAMKHQVQDDRLSMFRLNRIVSDADEKGVNRKGPLSLLPPYSTESRDADRIMNLMLGSGIDSEKGFFARKDEKDSRQHELDYFLSGGGDRGSPQEAHEWIRTELHHRGWTIGPFAKSSLNLAHTASTGILKNAKKIIQDLQSFYDIDTSAIAVKKARETNPGGISVPTGAATQQINEAAVLRVYIKKATASDVLVAMLRDMQIDLYQHVSAWLKKMSGHNIWGGDTKANLLVRIPSDKENPYDKSPRISFEIGTAYFMELTNSLGVAEASEDIARRLTECNLIRQIVPVVTEEGDADKIKSAIFEFYRFNDFWLKTLLNRHKEHKFCDQLGLNPKQVLRGLMILLDKFHIEEKFSSEAEWNRKDLSTQAAADQLAARFNSMNTSQLFPYFQIKKGDQGGRSETLLKDGKMILRVLRKLVDENPDEDVVKALATVKMRTELRAYTMTLHDNHDKYSLTPTQLCCNEC